MQYRLILTVFAFLVFVLAACVPYEEAKPDRESAKYHYSLGFAALSEQNPTEALKEFLQAEKYDARDPEIQAGLAQAYWLKRAHGLAEKHYKNALELSNGQRFQTAGFSQIEQWFQCFNFASFIAIK